MLNFDAKLAHECKRRAYKELRKLAIMSVSGDAIYDCLILLGKQFDEKELETIHEEVRAELGYDLRV